MVQELKINNRDLLVMNLVHYFMIEKNYSPVVVHGVNDEIWLENMEEDYKIVRIVSKYIHNKEQLGFDKFRSKRITKELKKKTLTLKMPVLSIYTDVGDTVELSNDETSDRVLVEKEKDIKNPTLVEVFPDIVEKTKHEEKGIELFLKFTNDINNNNTVKASKLDKIFSIKKPIITYAIIAICVIVFILMGGATDGKTLLSFGANLGLLVKQGEIYRLLTCAFVHIGIIHLAVNMYSLYVVGSQVENFYGKIKYLLIYLISAVCGSILSIGFTDNVISAGASGAIFGLLGAILYFGVKYRTYLGQTVKSQVIPIILINLIIGFTTPGIDNAAHIGGLIGGVLSAMALGINEQQDKSSKLNGIILLLLYITFIVYFAFFM